MNLVQFFFDTTLILLCSISASDPVFLCDASTIYNILETCARNLGVRSSSEANKCEYQEMDALEKKAVQQIL